MVDETTNLQAFLKASHEDSVLEAIEFVFRMNHDIVPAAIKNEVEDLQPAWQMMSEEERLSWLSGLYSGMKIMRKNVHHLLIDDIEEAAETSVDSALGDAFDDEEEEET